VLLALCSQPVHALGAYVVLASTTLYLLYVAFDIFKGYTQRLTRFRRSCRREKTVTTIVMMVLTVVMFSISATIFSLETFLFSDGLLHPQKYPKTVINFYGPEMTARIIIQGINVRHTRFPAHKTKRSFL